jgi:formate dehydrogenase (NADP+) beta subunit
MGTILFSSWQGELVDNRGKGERDRREPGNIKLPDEFMKGERIKAFMGWDGIVLCDEDVDIVDMCAEYAAAVQRESCGKCLPCRIGSLIVRDLLRKIADGQGRSEYLLRIRDLSHRIREGSKCQVGQTGLIPVLHALEHFPDAFSRSIAEGRKAASGKYRSAVTAPCMNVCPTSLNIPRYIEEIYEGKYGSSLATIRCGTCLPGTLGRVCVRPCESSCRRANMDESIAIKHLKRFVADYEIEKRTPHGVTREAPTGKNVAVIGAGPAGLSCAYSLGLKGYGVTIFERLPEPGGMAAVGIPDYRLPRSILRREADMVKDAGAEIRYNVTVGRDVTIADLQRDYDAIFIGVGAQGSSPMGVEGEDAGYRGFITGVQYLLDINLGLDPYPEGRKIVVVGGGNVAIDCVRSSFRIGKTDVNLVYRRTKKEMPADPVEIRDAEEEKVNFHYLCNPKRIIAEDGRVTGVECIRMELGEPDESGRRRPVPVPGSEFIIETDIVIPAIGQMIDLSFLQEKDGVQITRRNTLACDPDTFETSRKGIFTAGDCVTGPDVLVRAGGNGRRAADKIDRYLRGGVPEASPEERFISLFSAIKVYSKDEQLGIPGGRQKTPLRMLPPETRKLTFAEVEEGFKTSEALAEAARCLRCYRIGMVATA